VVLALIDLLKIVETSLIGLHEMDELGIFHEQVGLNKIKI